MGLKEYQEKRDFAKTPEPPGKIGDKGQHRFVVHRHQATHQNYKKSTENRLPEGGNCHIPICQKCSWRMRLNFGTATRLLKQMTLLEQRPCQSKRRIT